MKIKAISTRPEQNRFIAKLHLREKDGEIILVEKVGAQVTISVTLEYPTYGEELEAKKRFTLYDDNNGAYYTDYDSLRLWRVRRCLVDWDIPEKLEQLNTTHLRRVRGELIDESLTQWQTLPPLLRKAIAYRIDEALGAP